jgi:predicted peptidase
MNKIIISLLSILGFQAQAADFPEYEKHQYNNKLINENQALPYRMLLPENFDKNKVYPLVLFLHGAGERGSDNIAQLTHGASLFLAPQFREQYQVITVFPQAAAEDYWVNVDVRRDVSPIEFHFKSDAVQTMSMQLLNGLIDDLASRSYIDQNKMVVMGLSMGGMGTYEILANMPGAFQAAVAICGGGHPDLAKKMDINTPVWAFHGEDDDVVPLAASMTMVEAINAQGGKAELKVYPDTTHNSWDKTFAEPELFPWLFSHFDH